ncbi:hypothetical protein OSTOST_08654, partial [Ostertagia ostertagi]
RIGNSVHATCVLACTVLHETAAANALGSIKEIRFVDVKETIEQEIATQMKARFGRIGNSVHATCVLACTVLHETAAANALGSIKGHLVMMRRGQQGMAKEYEICKTRPKS